MFMMVAVRRRDRSQEWMAFGEPTTRNPLLRFAFPPPLLSDPSWSTRAEHNPRINSPMTLSCSHLRFVISRSLPQQCTPHLTALPSSCRSPPPSPESKSRLKSSKVIRQKRNIGSFLPGTYPYTRPPSGCLAVQCLVMF